MSINAHSMKSMTAELRKVAESWEINMLRRHTNRKLLGHPVRPRVEKAPEEWEKKLQHDNQEGAKKAPTDDEPDMSIQPVPGPAPVMRKGASLTMLSRAMRTARKLSDDNKKKMAAFDDPEKPSTAKVLGSSLLGMGAGMGLGYGAMRGIDALSRSSGGKGVPPGMAQAIMPFVGGAAGMTAPLLHYATLERMREEHARKQQMKAQEVPGGRQGS